MTYELANVKWGEDEFGRGSGTLTWSINLAGLQYSDSSTWGFTDQDFVDATAEAFQTWADVADVHFSEHVGAGEADIVITMDFLAGSTVGLATYWYTIDDDEIDTIVNATIEMDDSVIWSPMGENGDLNFYTVMVHEIGHVLGLDHVNDNTEIMNPVVSATELGDGDIEGIRLIYGSATPTTDGADVIVIALTSGDILFAKGGNDTVTGNSGGDTIFGGNGNDALSGGGGKDTLVDTLGINTLNGDGDNDVLVGGIGATNANGGGGADILIGGIGDDDLAGGAGNDTLAGDPSGFFYGDDTLDGGTGNDFLEGGGGADVFIFRPNEGSDTIAELSVNLGNPSGTSAIGADFTSGIDQLDLQAFGYADATEALSHFSNSGGDTVFSDQGTSITLVGLSLAELEAGDFIL